MTHHDFDLSEVLGALQSDESGDLVRQMVSFLYQVLIDAEAAERAQFINAAQGLWVTDAAFSTTRHGYTLGIRLSPPAGFDSLTPGSPTAVCQVRHEGHGAYQASADIPNGAMGISFAFPQDFLPLDHSRALMWPLPSGQFEIDWELGVLGYATRHAFTVDDYGQLGHP
ncbi:MAG TPA: hypothetical protein VMV53_03370 [Acidimicrobiales bacterium]|nr:hypothetical protein [Acidimicrobiales bacterium]